MIANNQSGILLSCEGGEGLGKSSVISFLESYLATKKIKTIRTREPGGTPLAERMRQLILGAKPEDEKISEITELLIMFASRSQHIENVIRPALNQGIWVLCDRFTDSTYAYQGGGRGVSFEKIAALESLVQDELRPDITFLFDAPVQTSLSRIKRRELTDNQLPDYFERQKIDFFERVRQGYLAIAERHPERVIIVDAQQSLEDVQNFVRSKVDQFIADNNFIF